MPSCAASVPILLGVTSDQTLLVLRSRIRALRDAGYSVGVISSPGPHLDRLAADGGLTIYSIPMRRGIAPLADLGAFLRIFVVLLRFHPSIVDFSTPKAALLGLTASWLLRIPVRIHTLRGLRLESARPTFRPLLLAAERLTAACAHVVLCNSPSLRGEATAHAIAPPAKLRLLANGSSNGVDLDRFQPAPTDLRVRYAIPHDALVLGFVGRLTRHKGIPELLDAFDRIHATMPQTWLLLVGWFDSSDDRLNPSFAARIASHPHIVHTGFVEDTAECYRAMDLLVLPTHREGFPNVALEAAASGLAVLTTTATGARDAVQPCVTGLLVPPGDSEALADAALRLLCDASLRHHMGAAARAWVTKDFSQQRVLADALCFYREIDQEIIREKGRQRP
jgi:glycosyltransferase involved in cell wall biosynthesis